MPPISFTNSVAHAMQALWRFNHGFQRVSANVPVRHCSVASPQLPTFWMCKTCAFVNPSDSSACTRCAQKLSDKQPIRAKPAVQSRSIQQRKLYPQKTARSWTCHICDMENSNKYACQTCAEPRVNPNGCSQILLRPHSSPETLWMCANCLNVQTFAKATCGVCHSTNDSFKVHGWTCRGCSKGHPKVTSEKCCEFFHQPTVPYAMPWLCACGQKNAIVYTRCLICLRGKQNLCAEADDWVCPCGCLQPSYRPKCAECAGSRKGAVATWLSNYRPVLENWRCTNCDIVNSKARVLCSQCKKTRRDASIRGIGQFIA